MSPPLVPLLIVRPSGNNTIIVINRATGKIITERFGHNNTTGHARELEVKAKQLNFNELEQTLRILFCVSARR